MAANKDTNDLKAQIYLEKRRGGETWVAYKMLVGYGRGNRVIVDDRGEHLYDSTEYATREAALESAKERIRRVVSEKFPESTALPVSYHVVEEGSSSTRRGAAVGSGDQSKPVTGRSDAS